MRSRSFPSTIAACVATALLLALALLWDRSPYMFASSFRTAAETADYTTLLKRMDIERVRQSLADEVSGDFSAELRSMTGANLPKVAIDVLNMSVKKFMLDPDRAPQRIASLLSGKGLVTTDTLEMIPASLRARRTVSTSGDYGDTRDIFLSRYSYRPTGEEAVVVMERAGWFTWYAVAIKLSSNSLLWPIQRQPK